METHGYRLIMQREMIREIEQASPKYLLFINIHTSWLAYAESEKLILAWANDYARKYYELAGVVELWPPEANYIWGEAAKTYKIKSRLNILILERR